MAARLGKIKESRRKKNTHMRLAKVYRVTLQGMSRAHAIAAKFVEHWPHPLARAPKTLFFHLPPTKNKHNIYSTQRYHVLHSASSTRTCVISGLKFSIFGSSIVNTLSLSFPLRKRAATLCPIFKPFPQ